MHRKHLTKITATLGPATSDPRIVQALFAAGVDVFRLNFSHGSHDDHRRSIETIRALEAEAGRPIAVLMDLQGPKLRIGPFAAAGGIVLEPGARFRLEPDDRPGDTRPVHLPHRATLAACYPGFAPPPPHGRLR